MRSEVGEKPKSYRDQWSQHFAEAGAVHFFNSLIGVNNLGSIYK